LIELVVATTNKKKKEELKSLLKGLKVRVLDLEQFPPRRKIKENASTFIGNAIKKVRYVAKVTGKLALADDSGLEVFALAGRPGVRSARFAGPKKDDRSNNLKLLRLLKNCSLKKRKAQFVCAVALADKNGFLKTAQGKCRGRLAWEMQGSYGFGYDPVFIPHGYKKTFAQLGPKIKNKISHRFIALSKVRKIIEDYLLRYS
jgi:XTP/dITP diphosphohydrolase